MLAAHWVQPNLPAPCVRSNRRVGPLDLAGGGQGAKIQPDAKIGHPMMTAVAKKLAIS